MVSNSQEDVSLGYIGQPVLDDQLDLLRKDFSWVFKQRRDILIIWSILTEGEHLACSGISLAMILLRIPQLDLTTPLLLIQRKKNSKTNKADTKTDYP